MKQFHKKDLLIGFGLGLTFIVILLLLISPVYGARNYYVSNSGTGDGSSCANARAITWNWSGVTGDDTVHLCGTITSQLSIPKSGTYGHPITLKFESGAKFSKAVWDGASGAISCSGQQYIVVDGNNTGIIENTDNGRLLGNHALSRGIYTTCDNMEIKGLIIQNLYIHVYNDETYDSVSTSGILASGNNFNAHHLTIHDAAEAITHVNTSGTTKSNIDLHHNTVYDCSWGVQAVVGAAGSITDNVNIYNNDITITEKWMTRGGSYHNNGSYCYSGDGLGLITNLSYYNNYIHASSSHYWTCSGFIHFDYGIKSAKVYNNLLVGDSNGYPSPGFITAGNGGIGTASAIIANNTVIGFNNTASGGIGWSADSGTATVKNNIVVGVFYPFSYSNTPITVIADNNDTYNYGAGYVYNPPPYNMFSLADWKIHLGGCPGTGHDCNTITSNPNLNSDYTQKVTSPTRGTGANLTSLGTTALNSDKKGVARPSSGPWDIGAYQYGTGK